MNRIAFMLALLLATNGFVLANPSTAKHDSIAMDKDGMVFEMVLPERVWAIPENKPGISSSIKLGLKITNNSAKSFCFNGYDALLVDIMTPDGKEAHSWEGRLGTKRYRMPVATDFPSVKPGKSTTLSIPADLFWPTLEDRTLMFRSWHASGSPARYYDNLKPGSYKIRINYENRRESFDVEQLVDHVWTGRIVTPCVQVSLREH